MIIIGVGHKCRQGKDTVANYLVKKYRFTKIGFADALYEECRNCQITLVSYNNKDCYNIYLNYKLVAHFNYNQTSKNFNDWFSNLKLDSHSYFYSYDGMVEKDPILMQWWGTEFRRKQDPDYWLKKMRMKIALVDEMAKRHNIDLKIVIPDMRFKNEVEMIKIEFGGEIWKLERYDIKVKKDFSAKLAHESKVPYIASGRDPNHQSETDLDNCPFDETLSAESGDLDSLYKQVDKIMELKEANEQ